MNQNILASKKILVVDDEPLFRSSLREGLEARAPSLSVFEAEDGLAALEVLGDHAIDVVVSDLRMPQLDGIGLLTEMLNRKLAAPVVLLSAFRTSINTAKAIGMGAIYFLDKPVEYDELVDAIECALASREHAQMRGFSLASVLQLMNFDRRSVAVAVRSGESIGHVFISGGEVVDAWFGEEYGRDAFCSILRLVDPTLELMSLPEQVQRSITSPLNGLLLGAFKENEGRRPFDALDQGWNDVVDSEFADLAPPASGGVRPEEVQRALQSAMRIKAALGSALVDYVSGTILGTAGGDAVNIEVAATGNTDVVRAKMQVMTNLGIEERIEDILITLAKQYHLIRPVLGTPLFLYLAIGSERGNLAMARRALASIAADLEG